MDEKKIKSDWKSLSNASSNTPNISNSSGERDKSSNTNNAPLHKHLSSTLYSGQNSLVPGRRRERWEGSSSTVGVDSRNPRKRDWDADRDGGSSFRERSHFRDRDHSDRERKRDQYRSSSVGIERGRARDRDFNSEKFRERARDRNSMPPRTSKHFNRSSYFDRDRDFRDSSKFRERYADRERKWIPKRDSIRDRPIKSSSVSTEADSGPVPAKLKTLHVVNSTNIPSQTDNQANAPSEKKDYYGPNDSLTAGKRHSFKSVKPISTKEDLYSEKEKEVRTRETDRVWEKPRDPRTRDSDKTWEKRDRVWDRDRDRDRSISTGRARDTPNASFRRARSYPTTSRTGENSRKDDQNDDIGSSSTSFQKRRSFHKPLHHQSGYQPYFKNNTWVKRPRQHYNESQKGASYERGYLPKHKYTPPINSSHSASNTTSENPPQRSKTIESIKPVHVPESTASIPTDPRLNQIPHSNKPTQDDDPSNTNNPSSQIATTPKPPQDPRHLNDPRRFQNPSMFVPRAQEEKPSQNTAPKKPMEKKAELKPASDPPPFEIEKPVITKTKQIEMKEVVKSEATIPSIENVKNDKNVLSIKPLKRQATDIQEEIKDPRKKKRIDENAVPKQEKNIHSLTCASLGPSDKVAKAERAVKKLGEIISKNKAEIKSADENGVALPTKSVIAKGISGLDAQIKNKQAAISTLKENIKDSLKAEEEQVKAIERQKAENEESSKKRQLEMKLMQSTIVDLNNVLKENEKCVKILSGKIDSKTEEVKENIPGSQESKGLDKNDRNNETLELDTRILQIQQELNETVEHYENTMSSAKDNQEEVDESKKVLRRLSMMDNSYMENGSILTTTQLSQGLKSLVNSVFMENKCIATEAHIDSLSSIPFGNEIDQLNNGEKCSSNMEWNYLIRQITSQANAIYINASKSPFFHENKKRHKRSRKHVAASIRFKKQKLLSHWKQLAHEYFIRQKRFIGESGGGAISSSLSSSHLNSGNFSIMGRMEHNESSETSLQSHSRSNSNPYRRPRRANGGISVSHQVGDVVRSEYEQEQIIAELTAKEAMEKRIATGFCALPRQRCQVEMGLFASFYDDQNHRRVLDPISVEEEKHYQNPWTDVEKCIFLDRFLQDPKNFRKIASSLRNKSTKDCIEFYYNSKKTVPYKQALREYHLRKKRRAENCWEGTIQAAIAMGAVILEGPSRDKPIIFSLPKHDNTYYTHSLHPMRRSIFDSLLEDSSEENESLYTTNRNRSEQVFLLDDFKFLRRLSRDKDVDEVVPKKKVSQEDSQSLAEGLLNLRKNDGAGKPSGEGKNASKQSVPNATTGSKKGSQKWSAEEKSLFTDTVEKHGRDWEKLGAAIKGKSMTQIKCYYYDHKKQSNKQQAKAASLVESKQEKPKAKESENPPEPNKMKNNEKEKEEKKLKSENVSDSTKTSLAETEVAQMSRYNPEAWKTHHHSVNYTPQLHQDLVAREQEKFALSHNGVLHANGSYPFLSSATRANGWLSGSHRMQVAPYVDNRGNSHWINNSRNGNYPLTSARSNYENMLLLGPHVNLEAERREQHMRHSYVTSRAQFNLQANGERNLSGLPVNNTQNAPAPWGNNQRRGPHDHFS